MIITTRQRPFRHFFDIVLTAFGWILSIIMFGTGIWNLLRDEVRGPDALFLSAQLTDSVSTVIGYILLMLSFTIFLILWAKYNQHRFSGVDRRKPPAPLVAAQLRTSFGVSEKQLGDIQTARFIVVAHDDEGDILAVRTVDEALKLRANQRGILPQQPVENVENAKATIIEERKQKSNHWFFLDPKFSAGYLSGNLWSAQHDAYVRSSGASLLAKT